jgi:sugar (pentulose or hexulose) kinase
VKEEPCFCGVDLGSGGLRAIRVTPDGEVARSVRRPISARRDGEGLHEQEPAEWVAALLDALDEILADSPPLHAIACTSTSGTIAALDPQGGFCGPALMYDDARALDEARLFAQRTGAPVKAGWGLPKMLWMARRFPAVRRWLHAVDVLNFALTGDAAVATDFTSALKSGWDGEWPDALPRATLPEVVAPGTTIGHLRSALLERWSLRGAVRIAAGATDANAAFYASGARGPGQWSSACGSTLAVRGAIERPFVDPEGRMYVHRHPSGGSLAAGASNAGRAGFPSVEEDGDGPPRLPERVRYPLPGRGERLPFRSPSAVGFEVATPGVSARLRDEAWFGLALVERWIYDVAVELGLPRPSVVFTTGGGAHDRFGMQARADVLGVPVARARHPDAAFGAALLAMDLPLDEAIGRMVSVEARLDPRPGFASWSGEALARMRERAARFG